MKLAGKVALVTGTSPNIGGGIAEGLAAEGAKLVCVDIRTENAEQCAAAIQRQGGEAFGLRCDVTDEAQVQSVIEAARERFGGLDVLVNNAVIFNQKGVLEMPLAEWRAQLAVILDGAFLCTKLAAKQMIAQGRGGAIINIASTGGVRPRPGLAIYNASKGAAISLTKALAIELAPENIRVTAVNPVAGETPLLATFMGADTPELREKFRSSVPLGRLSTPRDIANTVAFLASDEAAFLTGIAVEVDGGRCI